MNPDQDLSGFSLLDLFRMEADGQARVLIDGLLALEGGASAAPAQLDALMRAAHSLKGAAAIVGLDLLVQLAHALEDVFVAAQHGRVLDGAAIDALLAAVDSLVQAARVPEPELPAWMARHGGALLATSAQLRRLATGTAPAPSGTPGAGASALASTEGSDPSAPSSAPSATPGSGTSAPSDGRSAAAAPPPMSAHAAAAPSAPSHPLSAPSAPPAAATPQWADSGSDDAQDPLSDWPRADAAPSDQDPLSEAAARAGSAPADWVSDAAASDGPPHASTASASAGPRATAWSADPLLTLASESRIATGRLPAVSAALQRLKRQQRALLGQLDALQADLGEPDNPLRQRLRTLLHEAAPLQQLLHDQLDALDNYERRQTRLSTALVHEVLALRMRPFRDGVHAFPRMVRDLARSLGKEARLRIDGADTLVDRDVLTHIESPLNHLLRNAVDHGLEPPDERVAAGKPPAGTLVLSAHHRAGRLALELSDDGRGVDLERIRARVVERGMAAPALAAAMSPHELLAFLFLPAFSLKDAPTALSGRGVGLDLVQDAVRAQNGSVHLDTRPGQGLTVSISLPLTQSIVRALVVDIGAEPYALPIAHVGCVRTLARAALQTLEGKPFFELDGEHVGLVAAAPLLELAPGPAPADDLAVVVVGAAGRRYGLVVERIRGEASLVVQPLEPLFGKLRDLAAAAVLDDGAPVLLLDVADLLVAIERQLQAGALPALAGATSAPGAARARRVLVVDDSLTVREMERQLLAARGYAVDVAVDGMDGWNLVRGGDYDLVITDVDMPRLDGVELTTLIRADARLRALPVMIVSYKDRPEDRARGLAAGADHYLTKGSFHDATLLDAVADLIGPAHPGAAP